MGSDRSEATNLQSQIARLNQIGIALSSEHNLNKLLELIVTEARRFTVADGGSLYIKEGEKLNFLVAQTESLETKTQQKSQPIATIFLWKVRSRSNSVISLVR